jgi:hypothetical protein
MISKMITEQQRKGAQRIETVEIGFGDLFANDRPAGRVVGSYTPDGVRRRGIDKEKVLSVDNGALRIQPLIKPGWGRAGIAYGPYTRQNGLALSAFLLNGHNTAQSQPLNDTFVKRLHIWLAGSYVYRRRQRISQFLRSNRKMRLVRQLRWWFHTSRHTKPVPRIDENMALGFFSSEVPSNPVADGNAFVMHAVGPENGELWSRVASNQLPSITGLQNVQIYYVIILREKGAAYYAASVAGAHGLSTYPYLRPMAIDPFEDSGTLYAGLFQSVLGQVGFRLDTRLYGIRVSKLDDLSEWYGTAHAADTLTGKGSLSLSLAEIGGSWRVFSGQYDRAEHGALPSGDNNLAVLDPGLQSGLVHMLVEPKTVDASFDAVWRLKDKDNHWRLSFDRSGCRLVIRENGEDVTLSSSEKQTLAPGKTNSIQVLDDGNKISLYLQGQLLFSSWFTDSRLQAATGVGFRTEHPSHGLHIRQFEAHPRGVRLPSVLDVGEPWLRKGTRTIVSENFEGPARDIAGKATSIGSKVWKKQIGKGVIEALGDCSGRIRKPSPGRTAYTIDWDHPEFADLEITITPPGTGRGQKEHGLSGFIFWQDEKNYFTINIWVADSHPGASISTFFHIDDFEDLYDAIWSNVGARVLWGVPCRLRVVFDGMHYVAFVNGEPVLYRSLTDVYPHCPRQQVNRVGIISNWEWGKDTGSVFNNFVARV